MGATQGQSGLGAPPEQRRLIARFEGRVQGVGFRYTAVDLAQNLGLTGFVRNMLDGSVELVAEGPEADLRSLLSKIQRSNLGRYIVDVHQQWAPARGEFADFSISFDV